VQRSGPFGRRDQRRRTTPPPAGRSAAVSSQQVRPFATPLLCRSVNLDPPRERGTLERRPLTSTPEHTNPPSFPSRAQRRKSCARIRRSPSPRSYCTQSSGLKERHLLVKERSARPEQHGLLRQAVEGMLQLSGAEDQGKPPPVPFSYSSWQHHRIAASAPLPASTERPQTWRPPRCGVGAGGEEAPQPSGWGNAPSRHRQC
jgi:hypothetical protein